ncbi:hypothetical protein D3C80_1562300 [compost metagenome]
MHTGHHTIARRFAGKGIGQSQQCPSGIAVVKGNQYFISAIVGMLRLFTRTAAPYFIDQVQCRTGHKGRSQGHEYQHGKNLFRQYAQVITDIEHDQLHKAAGIHKRSYREAVFPGLAHKPGRQRTAYKFAYYCHQDDQAADTP